MTNQTRKTATGLAILATIFAAGRPAAAADGGPATVTASAPSMSRVRSSNAAIGALIHEATARSTTFRGLVERIDGSDGIVYVEPGRCPHGVRACLVAVTTAGAHRMLRVKVDPEKAKWDLMGSIGHELRHALEVLAERSVTDNTAMFFFYQREGLRRGAAFETTAAIDAGTAVRAEVRQSMRAAQVR